MQSVNIEQYQVVNHTDINQINAKVNELLQDGWQLWGNIVVLKSTYNIYYIQTLVKEKALE